MTEPAEVIQLEIELNPKTAAETPKGCKHIYTKYNRAYDICTLCGRIWGVNWVDAGWEGGPKRFSP